MRDLLASSFLTWNVPSLIPPYLTSSLPSLTSQISPLTTRSSYCNVIWNLVWQKLSFLSTIFLIYFPVTQAHNLCIAMQYISFTCSQHPSSGQILLFLPLHFQHPFTCHFILLQLVQNTAAAFIFFLGFLHCVLVRNCRSLQAAAGVHSRLTLLCTDLLRGMGFLFNMYPTVLSTLWIYFPASPASQS